MDAAREDLRVILAGNDNADQTRLRRSRTVTPCERIPDQVRIPVLRPGVGMKQYLGNMSHRHLVSATFGKALIRLGNLEAELAVDPGTKGIIRFRTSRLLLFNRILQDPGFRFKLLRCPLSGVDQCQRCRTQGKYTSEIKSAQECIRRPVRLKPGADIGALGNLVLISVKHVYLGMLREIVTDQADRVCGQFSVIITGDQNIRFALFGQNIVFQM